MEIVLWGIFCIVGSHMVGKSLFIFPHFQVFLFSHESRPNYASSFPTCAGAGERGVGRREVGEGMYESMGHDSGFVCPFWLGPGKKKI